jgi:hypothetical protein
LGDSIGYCHRKCNGLSANLTKKARIAQLREQPQQLSADSLKNGNGRGNGTDEAFAELLSLK